MGKTTQKSKPLFWISGNYYDCRKQWNWIIKMLHNPNVEMLDCGVSASDGRVSKASDVIRLLKNRDMFDSRPRIIKMKGLPDDYTEITDYLKLVNNDNILVIDGPIGHRMSRGSRIITAKTSKFYKIFAAEGVRTSPHSGTGVFDFPIEVETDDKAREWVRGVLSDLNREMEDDAVALLVEQKGRNLDELYAELQCLVDYQPQKITVSDVKELVVPLFVSTAWNLCDMLDNQNYNDAIKHMQGFYTVAGRQVGESFCGDVMKLLGALAQHFTFILHLKYGCGDASKLTYDRAAASIEGLTRKSDTGEKSEMFSKGYLYVNIKKDTTKRALGLAKERLEDIFLDLCRTRFLCRKKYANDEVAMKICCDTFIMTACGIIEPHDSAAIKGYRRWHRSATI